MTRPTNFIGDAVDFLLSFLGAGSIPTNMLHGACIMCLLTYFEINEDYRRRSKLIAKLHEWYTVSGTDVDGGDN